MARACIGIPFVCDCGRPIDSQIDNEVSRKTHLSLGFEEVDRIVCFRKAL
jgi:hypothetical protein